MRPRDSQRARCRVTPRLACESPTRKGAIRACETWPADRQATVSTLGCQVGLADSLADGTVWAAGRNLPDMSLAFALMAAINGSTGSCATPSHGLSLPHQPRRRWPGGPGDSHPSGMAARAAPRALSRKVDAPELGCDRVTNPARRRVIAARTLAIKSRICHLNRQSPSGRVGWLCVTNNRDVYVTTSA